MDSQCPLFTSFPLEARLDAKEIKVCRLGSQVLDGSGLCVFYHRYDASTGELVCDKLGVVYPIIDGIPNLIPGDARLIKNASEGSGRTSNDSD